MKLIKLISDDIQEGVWKNSLYQPLNLMPGSEVAVKNLSVQFNDPYFTIDATNNTFTLKTAEDKSQPVYPIILTNGRYRLNDLIREVQLKLNNRLNSTSFDANLMFQVGPEVNLSNSNLQLIIAFGRKITMNITGGDCLSTNITFGTPNFFQTTPLNDGLYNGRLYTKTLYSNGGGLLECLVKNQDASDIKLSNWFLGIGEQWNYDLTLKDEIIAGLYACFGSSNGFYSYKKNYLMVESTVAITADDKLTIGKQGGKIKYQIERGGAVVLDVEGDNINEKIPLFGVNNLVSMMFIGDDAGKIAFSTLRQIPNPFVVSNNNLFSVIPPEDVQNIYLDGSLNGTKNTKITLTFPTPGIKQLLGFSSSVISQDAIYYRFIGNLGLDINLISNNLEVEIDEMPIYNYSHSTKQIRPIVMTIPASDMRNNIINQGASFFELSYSESATFLFFDLKNKHEISIPSLTVRILNESGQIVEVNGKCSLTLLIKEPKNNLE